MRHAIVVFDPVGKEHEGEILSGNAISVAQARGVVLLPLELDALRRGGASGWVKRSYGEGWRYDPVMAARGCPLILFAEAAYPNLEWVARLQAELEGGRCGSLRLATDTAQAGGGAAGLSPEAGPVQVQKLGDPDETGGWFIRGRARVMLPSDMFLALQLYGQVGGARVRWFAVSQTR